MRKIKVVVTEKQNVYLVTNQNYQLNLDFSVCQVFRPKHTIKDTSIEICTTSVIHFIGALL